MDWQKFEEEFLSALRALPDGSLRDIFDLQFEAQLSYFFELAPIQDPFRFRARHLGRRVAVLLIDEKGELNHSLLSEILRLMDKGVFLLGPKREGDPLLYAHIQDCLSALDREKQVWLALKKFSPPLCHKKAEEAIRHTLWPEPIKKVETHHIRRAALASWLTLLRQTTGSCFATAPAILIQKNPIQFFKDLNELLSIGQLKRVFAGQEYAVPMCPSIGTGELAKPLKSREGIAFSPGLIAGLSAAQILPADESLLGKARRLDALIQELNEAATPEQVLRALSLQGAELTEEDVADEEYLARIQMGPLIAREGAVFYQKPSLRAQKVADWKKRFQAAKIAFLGLTDCALLRVWEYTVASFCDVKTDFAKWNLYVSLGMDAKEQGGIADFLYNRINQRLQETNEEIQRLQRVYERAIYAVRSLESLLHRSGDSHRYELQGKLSGAVHEANLALDERDRAVRRADAIAGFFAALMQHYGTKFQEYFQEVFDPSVAEKEEHLFEDSPAGFRLLYKHGRADASTWELIHGKDGYIQALRSFFAAVEGEIAVPAGLEKEYVSQLTTELIQFIQEDGFLEGALHRSRSVGRKTPWDYVSGGTMQSLVQAYWSRSSPVSEVPILPKSANELLQFLSKQKKEDRLLMHSPTHAFVLKLGLLPENAEAMSQENASAVKKWKVTEEIQEHIGHSFSEKLPPDERALFLHLFRQKQTARTPGQLRQFLLEAVPKKASAVVDSHLFEYAFFSNKVHDALQAILKPFAIKKISLSISETHASLAGTYELHQMAKRILLEALRQPVGSEDWDEKIASQMRKLGFAFPNSLLFADTNWAGWFFGFVSNVFTGQIEIWRLNRIGTQGFPMSDWAEWLSPSNKTPWVLLPRTIEYE